MATKAATYLAFQSVVKRTLTTSTAARAFPRPKPLNSLPPHHHLASKAPKGRKLPKNHFTSSSPTVEGRERREPKNKRKAAHRQGENTSLRRVAVEAERSRGTPIKGNGRTRHVDPDVETKDVTAYCAAEQYNLHVARDLLKREGYEPDPFHTALFPQVLHVQTPPAWLGGSKHVDTSTESADEQKGDIFVFPSGSVVVWNVTDKLGRHLVNRLLAPSAAKGPLEGQDVEDLEYIEDPTREHSRIVGDTIILGTKPSAHPDAESTTPPSATSAEETRSPELDTTLAKIAFSSALARSTKLGVLENTLDNYMLSTRSIPTDLAAGKKPSVTRKAVLQKTAELLSLRAKLNLDSELTDSLPDIFWDSPHELGLESYYDQVSAALDVDIRIKVLNEKMDYASEMAAVLRETLGEKQSHFLEWTIIWLIVVEVIFGFYHIGVEWAEWADPLSEENLAKAWYLRELEAGRAREVLGMGEGSKRKAGKE